MAQPSELAMLQFTAEGERVWVPGWDPTYPAGDADSAGTVFLTSAHGRDTTVARVTYELTALSDEAAAELERFAADYPAMMAEWEHGIAVQLPNP